MAHSATDVRMPPPKAPAKKKRRRATGWFDVPASLAVILPLLWLAWQERAERWIVAEDGPGYWLGIVGGTMMLAVLIYPLRKRLPGLRNLGTIPGWFRIHMLLGLFGPALVILHSGFRFGSLNSAVAFFVMLTVAGSGLIGRFLYGHIHRGLYGRRQSLEAEMAELAQVQEEIAHMPGLSKATARIIEKWEKGRGVNAKGVVWAMLGAAYAPMMVARERRKLDRVLAYSGATRDELRRLEPTLDRLHRAQVKLRSFVFYERMFALWHVLHLPLFVLLVAAAILHVVAVHLF